MLVNLLYFSFPGLTQDHLNPAFNLLNQLNFITPRSTVPSFCRSVKCSCQTFSMHLVARFIAGRHFVSMCAYSGVHTLHTIIASLEAVHVNKLSKRVSSVLVQRITDWKRWTMIS